MGDETRELEAMKNDIKTPIRDKYGHIVSQHPAARGDSTALESKRRKMQQTIAFGRTSANKAMKANPSNHGTMKPNSNKLNQRVH